VTGVGRETSPRPGRQLTPDDRAPSRFTRDHPTTLTGQVVKIVMLGLAGALAVWGALPLVSAHAWPGLVVLILVTALIFYGYLSPRQLASKYLLPGTLLLLAFQVVPVLYTLSTSLTNFGDGHRGGKRDAIIEIQTASVKQVPGSPEWGLSVATTGDPSTGPLVFLLENPKTSLSYVGDAKGLRALDPGSVTVSGGRITAADGYTILNGGQISARNDVVTGLRVPTSGGAIAANGFTTAYEGVASQHYDAGCDCVTDTSSGHVWKADNATGLFTDSQGRHLTQGWKVGVGFANFTKALTDKRITGHFVGTLVWNFGFAIASVAVTFALGLFCALAMHSDRIRGKTGYRVLMILPYAMPSFAMLLVWSDMFNQDFGLVNRLLGTHVDWFGGTWSARFAVVLIQLWLGYPYMFLVAMGALQAIPKEMTEAATVDGASAFQRFRKVTLPLLMVSLTPLLIASFAFNFNNFNAIHLTTDGGPFPADNPTVGATDLLITYTYRLAFGGSGAQFGFAAAISFFIFFIVGTISVISFRRTRTQEEVYG
jgi:arabinogalactan oligomer/maltooligosaccharide transport system permease protein